MSNKNYVTYEEFGAVGDGVTEDFLAIARAHEYANENGLAVKAKDGATYYIKTVAKPAVIKTDTDWGTAKFIIDDRYIKIYGEEKSFLPERTVSIFNIAPDEAPYDMEIPEGLSLKKGAKNIGLKFPKPVMIRVVNSNHKDYVRFGVNENKGDDRAEVLLVDANGNISEKTPVQQDYDVITGVTVFSTDEKSITVCGGEFTTYLNCPETLHPDYVNNYYYFSRNIVCKRSNTVITNVKHYNLYTLGGELIKLADYIARTTLPERYGAPYAGFFTISNSYGCVLKNCVVTGLYEYRFNAGRGTNVMGSYEAQVSWCIDPIIDGVYQSNDILDHRNQHGWIGTNFVRNAEVKNCRIDRFDSHKGIYNLYLHDSTIGWGINLIGGGKIVLENVKKVTGGSFIFLRHDYGSYLDADLIVKNCSWGGHPGSKVNFFSWNWYQWDFGYRCTMPRTVTIEDFYYWGEAGTLAMFSDNISHKDKITKQSDIRTDKINPYGITKKITFKNTAPIPMSHTETDLFDDVEVEVI